MPAVSLNRFYAAEGVRCCNLETWRLAQGPASQLDAIVSYCVGQVSTGDHAAKEAACLCLADVCANAVGDQAKAVFEAKAAQCLEALQGCFEDESWTVRDAAFAASATIIDACPAES